MDAQRVAVRVRRARDRAARRRAVRARAESRRSSSGPARKRATRRRSSSACSRSIRARAAKTPFESLRRLLREQFDQILAHDPGTRLGTDPESLHDMRVAVRRTRALLRAGAPLDRDATRRCCRSSCNGSARCSATFAISTSCSRGCATRRRHSTRAIAPPPARLLRTLERQRTRARRTMLKALDGQRYDTLLDRFDDVAHDARAEPRARSTLETLAQRELEAAAPRRAGARPGARRTTRCTRCGSEASACVTHTSSPARRRSSKRAKEFQDVLGEHQDSVVAEERLRALSQDAPARPGARGRTADRARARTSRRGSRLVAQGVATARARREVSLVRAAGGLVLRDGEVLLVHRPRYDDWTFPKGKARRRRDRRGRARSARCTRRRASSAVSRDEAGTTEYVDSRGRPKRVRWWLMEPLQGEFTPNDEVDEVRWAEPADGREAAQLRPRSRAARAALP